ncbi:MAG: ferredoxin--NADP reductase [Bacteroidia bacterium]|nr:ferredoxin--NADP reductase [Bacteroidia bacterium]
MRKLFYPVPIDEIRDETPDAYTLFFLPPDPVAFRYEAGQYLTLRTWIGEAEHRRAFSLSSSPLTDSRLGVTIKRVDKGLVSNHLRDAFEAGDELEIMPPMGRFTVVPDPGRSRNYVLIGAGSGITPLFSILKTVLAGEPLSKVTLWYGCRDESSVIFYDQLRALQAQYAPRLELYLTLTQPAEGWKGFRGRLDQRRIYDLLSELFMEDEFRKVYYVCGPQGMMDAAHAAFDKHAVNFADVHQEFFSAPLPPEEEVLAAHSGTNGQSAAPVQDVLADGEEVYTIERREVQVLLGGETHLLTVEPEQSILDAAIQARLDPPYACQSGICTTCRAMLHAGAVAMDESEGLSEDELRQGYILTCQSHPLTESVVVEFG